MMHTWKMRTTIKDAVFGPYFAANTTDARCMYNTANFYIRNTMTGVRKSPEERTANETEVLHYVFTGIQKANERTERRWREDLVKCMQLKGLQKHAALARFAMKKYKFFEYPSMDKWFLSYETLDAIFKVTGHPVYKRMNSQVNQNAIRKVTKAWKAYFKSIKDYRCNPQKYKAKPRMPGYIRSEQTTAWFTGQVAKLVVKGGKAYLQFVKQKALFCIGKASLYSGMKYVKTEVKPVHGQFTVCITFEDGLQLPKVPDHPVRIIGIDQGMDNFAAVANNFGETPFLVKGGAVKAANQLFNKKRAILLSELTKGNDSTHSAKDSRQLSAISRKREDFIRDFFYKTAWYICRFAKAHQADVIVLGHNEDQKQELDLGHVTNQNFIAIPFSSFQSVLVITAAKCGISVIVREESYTSKASLLDGDAIPTYGKNDGISRQFSGRRIKRGLYRSADGTCLNADVNGAGNILRKEYAYAFDGQDMAYLHRTTKVIGYKDLYPKAVSTCGKNYNGKTHLSGKGHICHKRYRDARKTELKQIFFKEKRIYHKKPA